MKSPFELFFKLGDKVTKGDIKRKTDYDYYFLWLMFLAFLSLLITNFLRFIDSKNLMNLAWCFVLIAILWFQYNSLKQVYEIRKMLNQKIPEKIESEEEMLKGFEKTENTSDKLESEEDTLKDFERVKEENKEIFDKELKGGDEMHE